MYTTPHDVLLRAFLPTPKTDTEILEARFLDAVVFVGVGNLVDYLKRFKHIIRGRDAFYILLKTYSFEENDRSLFEMINGP